MDGRGIPCHRATSSSRRWNNCPLWCIRIWLIRSFLITFPSFISDIILARKKLSMLVDWLCVPLPLLQTIMRLRRRSCCNLFWDQPEALRYWKRRQTRAGILRELICEGPPKRVSSFSPAGEYIYGRRARHWSFEARAAPKHGNRVCPGVSFNASQSRGDRRNISHCTS